MPNWCSGNIRFRGKMDDILKLLRERVRYCYYDGETRNNVTKPVNVEYDEWEVKISAPNIAHGSWSYIAGTHRNFLNLYEGSDFTSSSVHDAKDENDKDIVVFDNFSAAWSIEPEPYMEMSKKYNVDIKIFGWERGIGFDQEIEIVDGNLVKNHCSVFKNYADWMWNTALPYMGG